MEICHCGTCNECLEHRGSRMPLGIDPIPPYTEPQPEDIREKEEG